MTTDSTCKVFLAGDPANADATYLEIRNVLQRAGMEVVEAPVSVADEADYIHKLKGILAGTRCSIQILDSKYGATLPGNNVSLAKLQYTLCRERVINEQGSFKMFIWYPPAVLAADKEPLQEEFIIEIRNSIVQNMVFTNCSSSIQLADDIRHMLEEKEKTWFEVKESEIFLVFNQLDETEATGVVDMLSDIVDVEKLTIIQDSETDYSELCKQQISKSKLAVVYFKESSDWALPFAQQVWKKVGGASSHTPILLIGDEDPDSNMGKKFNAPKVISLIVSGELIPLEIKVQYDKILEAIGK